jgi:hypothetical protein
VLHVQSNLCTTTTLGTPNLWPLLTDVRCLGVDLCDKDSNWDLLQISGYMEVVVSSGLIVI